MNIVYHYPPELLNLLIDTIPLLFRSKQDVLVFFRGAGVNDNVTDDLWMRVAQNREGINKYEIVRTTLTRLNDKGEQTLQERREILKRITEFEDFSTCWPNDQLKAKGLVAEVRRVINVKDSFTRMHQAQEQERKLRLAEHEAKINAIRQKQEELAAVKTDLFSLFSMPDSESQKRGKLLESCLNRLFNASGVLLREAFEIVGGEGEGVVEQIDGVIEIDGYLYLVEMKWWKKPLGKAEVSPHLVNIFNRGHAGGIMISASGYTQPAITVCREALSQKIIALCELEEIVLLLERKHDLQAFLKMKFQAAIMDKKPLYKPFNQGNGA